jgi:predicted nucleotidyltransferase
MSRTDRAADEARAAAVALLQELGERLWGVVLFGSAARGEATANSDLDLLVVADGLPERLTERLRLLRQSLPGHLRGRASVIARTRREFEEAFPSLYLDIGLDGVVLWDRDGYTRQRLERIRALIGEAGLSRAPTRGGFEWRWTTPPAGHWRVDWDGVHGLRA